MDEKEVKGKLLKVGIVRLHKAEYLIKNLLGNEPYAIMPAQKQILKRLKTLVECGKDFAIDLRKTTEWSWNSRNFGRYRIKFFIDASFLSCRM